VFIDAHGRALLSDFGLVIVGENTAGRIGAATEYHQGQTVRWTAPEILDGGKKTTAGDVYAFGCVCLAVSVLVRLVG
jgi:serine/threonine protein kinase